jgi:hypothetical protein
MMIELMETALLVVVLLWEEVLTIMMAVMLMNLTADDVDDLHD